MVQKTLFVGVSDFGSIAGVNPYASREMTLIRYWSKDNVANAFEVLKKIGYIVETEEEIPVPENLNKVEAQFEREIKRKRPSSEADANELREKYAKKVSEACRKDNLSEDVAEKIQQNISSKLNKSCGKNSALNTLENTAARTGYVVVKKRKPKTYYKVIFEDMEYKYLIGGKVDGISRSLVVDAKYRTCEENVRKNEYDLYQLLGCLFVTGKATGKIVQKCGNKIWDSDVETDIEWGLVKKAKNKKWLNFLNNDLVSFFESLKKDPLDFSMLEKPFLKISQGVLHPVKGVGEFENFLIDHFRQNSYLLPIVRKPLAEKNKSQ